MTTTFKNINEYISICPPNTQPKLEELRKIIHQAVPNLQEVISYNMPAFKINKILVYFALNKKHIGFYPTPSAVVKFAKELQTYTTTKGSIHFDLDKPLPQDLIIQIVQFRRLEDSIK